MTTFIHTQIDDSIIKVEKRFLMGQEVEFGTPDSKALRDRLSQHYQLGQTLLKDFKEWLIRSKNLSECTATMYTRNVFISLCLTYDNGETKPWEVLDNDGYAISTRSQLRTALKHYAVYTKDPDLITHVELSSLAHRTASPMRRPGQAKKEKVFITKTKIKGVLTQISKLRGDPRLPWAADCLTLAVKGAFWASELVTLERKQIILALGGSGITTQQRTTRFIPTALIKNELESLIRTPYHWNILADLISPASAPRPRIAQAAHKVNVEMRKIMRAAGLPELARTWSLHMRRSVVKVYWQESNNLVAAAQMLGAKDLRLVKYKLGIKRKSIL